MSVISVKKRTTETRSSRTQTKPTPPDYELIVNEVYLVETDDVNDGPVVAETANAPPWGQVPLLGSQHPNDPTRRVRSVMPAASPDSQYLWIVAVEYSSKASDGNPALVENPLARPAEISWDFEDTTEPRYTYEDGSAILNTNGELLDPQPQEIVSDGIMTYTRNYSAFDITTFLDFKDAVNRTDWTVPGTGGRTAPAGCAKIKGLSANQQTENNVAFVRISVRVGFKSLNQDGSGGWTQRIPAMGRNELKSSPTSPGTLALRAILDDLGQPVSDPVFLTDVGRAVKDVAGAVPHFINIPPKKTRDFSTLNLT